MRVAEYRAELESIGDADIAAYLSARSNLPGPRGNLSLLEAFATNQRAAIVLDLLSSDDEFVAACAAAACGPLLAGGGSGSAPTADFEEAIVRAAADARWRVREGAAMAVQYCGDVDPAAARRLTKRLLDSGDPLVQRAAVAGICEPRLLRDPDTAALALDACERATTWLVARPTEERRRPEVRTLRQGLGYCWSVAIAASPEAGLVKFAALRELSDADVAWIVRENSKKARLAKLLDAQD